MRSCINWALAARTLFRFCFVLFTELSGVLANNDAKGRTKSVSNLQIFIKHSFLLYFIYELLMSAVTGVTVSLDRK